MFEVLKRYFHFHKLYLKKLFFLRTDDSNNFKFKIHFLNFFIYIRDLAKKNQTTPIIEP